MIRKIILSLFLLGFIFIVAVFFLGSSILSTSIKAGVETFGPKVTQTSVQLNDVDISILSGDGELTGLYVGNPEGFSDKDIFALDQIELLTQVRSIFSDEIVIDKIHIQKPHINYEKTLKRSNLKELLKNIEASVPSGEQEETKEVEEVADRPDEPGKNVLIKEFIIEDPTVSLSLLGVGAMITLPTIELNDLSSSSDEIIVETLRQIISELSEAIKSAAASKASPEDSTKDILDSVTDPYEEPIKEINNTLNDLIGQ